MRRRLPFSEFLIVVLVSLTLPAAYGQKKNTVAPQDLFNVLPSAVAPHAEALGDRVLHAGKERTLLTGQFVNDRGVRFPMRVVLQLPRAVGLEGLRPKMPAIVFDGKTPVYSATKEEEELLEIFSSDTAEAMLASVKDEAAVQLLGRRVKAEPQSPQNEGAPMYDIYEVGATAPFSAAKGDRLKRYSFDSDTGLLANTQYFDETFSPPIKVEIRFSDWRRVDGSAYPGRIDRLENGLLIFSWLATRIQALPRQDLSNFGVPAETGR